MQKSLSKFKAILIVLFVFCFVNAKSMVLQTGNSDNPNQTDLVDGNPQTKELNGEVDSMQIQFQKELTEADGDSLKIFTAYLEYGKYLNKEGELEQSIDQFKIALRIVKNASNHEKVADVANWLANAYAYTGDFKSSNETYKIALESAEEIGDGGEIAKISMNLASNYNFGGEYEKAIKYGLYALKTKETTNNLERICYHYIAMGNIFRENNNIIKWEEYVQKAYKMKEVEGCASFVDKIKIYNSLGGIAVQLEDFEKGLLYYDTLMLLSNDGEYDQGISTSLTNSAGIYKQLENFPKALELSTEAEKYFDDNPYSRIFNNNFKAELYQLMGEEKKGLELVRKNIETEEIIYYSTEQLKCLQLLYELNFNSGNYDQAFFWNDSLRNTESILRDEDIRQSIEELETKYQTEKKEQQIELLQAENKIKHQEFIVSIATTVAVILILIIGVLLYLKKRKQNQVKQLLLRQQLLRSQMNPHFLFNALGSIQNFMYKNETKKAAGYLGNFASLTRAILEHSAEEFVPLSAEIETLDNYVKLEQMRVKNSFEYKIEYDDELDTEFLNVPPMLIQPFVENAVKHGLKNLNYPGLLTIHFYEIDDELHIKVADNGHGINTAKTSDENAKTHRSMSMQIFKERCDILSHHFKKDVRFELIDRSERNENESGTEVLIVIPV